MDDTHSTGQMLAAPADRPQRVHPQPHVMLGVGLQQQFPLIAPVQPTGGGGRRHRRGAAAQSARRRLRVVERQMLVGLGAGGRLVLEGVLLEVLLLVRHRGQLEDVLPLGVVALGHVEVGEIDDSGRFWALRGREREEK